MLMAVQFVLMLDSNPPKEVPRAFVEAAWPESMGSYIVSLFKTMIPGIAAAAAGFSVWSNRKQMSKPVLSAAILALAMAVLFVPLLQAAENQTEAAAPQMQAAAAQPHSGEELMQASGKFVRLSDPRQQPGRPVEEGWQQALWKSMTQAIATEEAQVVMVFSRQGCPWCDRLVKVLHKAIQQRAAFIESEEAASVGGLLAAPLRVFVYDAKEFRPLVEQFRLEGFPTMLFFGRRGVKPAMVPGYLSDEDFGRVLSDVANAQPERAGGRKRGKLFGIFR